ERWIRTVDTAAPSGGFRRPPPIPEFVRLSAGGNWIRTSGSARDSVRFSWSRCLASASSRRPPKGCGVRSTPLSFFSLTRARETKKIKAEKYSEGCERRIVAETQEPWGINVSEARLCIGHPAIGCNDRRATA